jgi:hypothetical protein
MGERDEFRPKTARPGWQRPPPSGGPVPGQVPQVPQRREEISGDGIRRFAPVTADLDAKRPCCWICGISTSLLN